MEILKNWRAVSRPAHKSLIVGSPPHAVAVKPDPALNEIAYRTGIDHVLLCQHARGQHRLGIVLEHRNNGLLNDRTVIQFCRHEMHGRTMKFHTGLECLAVRGKARKTRQQ